jgi:hypothetical protein
MNVEIGTDAAQFPEKESINGIFIAVQYAECYLFMIVVIFLNPLQLSENLFSHMSQEEQRELALQYSSGDSHVKVMQYCLLKRLLLVFHFSK